jgi:DNA-binding NtrC family response regulator
MPIYSAFSADAQVLGEIVLAFLRCMNYNNVAPFLMRHGLLGRHGFQTVDPEQWYSQQGWLNVLSDLTEERPDSSSADLLSIGMKMFETIVFPRGFESLTVDQVLVDWGAFYAEKHRGTDIGEVTAELVNDRHIKMRTRVPYPDDIHYGLFYAMLRHFCPEGMDFVVAYDESVLRRGHGGKTTVYDITLCPRDSEKAALTAEDILNVSETGTLLIEIPITVNDALINSRVIENTEIVFRVNGNNVKTALSLRPSFGGDYRSSGSLMMLRLPHDGQPLRQAAEQPGPLSQENFSVSSLAMRPVIRQARIAAHGTAPVLLRGENGVGKTFLARAIHQESDRSEQPLVEINCQIIPHRHMVGEILGYSDTPEHSRPSQFEIANEGTLLFEQIEYLSLEMQEILLQVIENGYVMRLGTSYPIPIDVRIIATTTQDLGQLIADGTFLSPLYYRFNVFNLHVPPLRDRVKDIPFLIDLLLEHIAIRYGQHCLIEVEDDACDMLCQYPWPGNIRELESILEAAFRQRMENLIRVADLPDTVRAGRVLMQTSPQAKPILSRAEAEREAILRAGWATEGRITEMADLLGMGRTTLWRKMKRLNLTPDYFKR